MRGLTSDLLARACRTFLARAYPGGEHTIPAAKRAFLRLDPDQPLEPLLRPPLCQTLPDRNGGVRGYALRLGSSIYPHLKLQAVDSDQRGTVVFAVDTHDALQLEERHPDSGAWVQLQHANRQLKEQIERAWEAEGLLTFNGLLRRQLEGERR